jgi:hypothetical protein
MPGMLALGFSGEPLDFSPLRRRRRRIRTSRISSGRCTLFRKGCDNNPTADVIFKQVSRRKKWLTTQLLGRIQIIF